MASLNLGLRVGAQHHRLLRVTADSKRTLYELAARRAESTAEGVDVGVVEDAVDHGGGNSLVAENLRDRLDAGSLPAGATIRILVRPPVQLGNRGGLITLLDSSGLKVDGVAYTQTHAAEGWSVVF